MGIALNPPALRAVTGRVPAPATKRALNPLQAKLDEGLAHHQAGRFAQADAAYARVLQLDPRQPDALRLRAIILSSQGNPFAAIPLLEAALKARSNFPEAHYTLANILQAQGNLAAAIPHYDQAIKQRPNFPEAQWNLGNALAASDRYPEAVASYRAALKGNPNVPDLHHNLSVALRKTGQLAEALVAALRAVQLKPDYADAHNNLGIVLKLLGRREEAIASYRKALQLAPTLGEACTNLGQALDDAGATEDAIEHFRKALAMDPSQADAHFGLAAALQNLGRLDEATASYRAALALRPTHAETLNNLGAVYHRQKRYPEAEQCLRQAVALKSSLHEAWSNLGAALQQLKRWDDAIEALRRAIELSPDYPDAYNNLGLVLKLKNDLLGAEWALRHAITLKADYAEAHNNLANVQLSLCRGEEALTSYARAASLNPALPLVAFNQGVASLLLGRFKEGWPQYEHRFDTWLPHERRHQDRPRLTAESSVQGMRVLLHAEQGLGDTLQFIRYAPLLTAKGATVYLEVQSGLKELVRSMPGVAGVFAQFEPLPEFDLQCPLLSVPLAFGTELTTVPAATPYLHVAPERLDEWTNRLAVGQSRKVGLVWSGNPNHENDHNRSVPLAQLASILALPDVHFFSLQKQLSTEDERLLAACPNVTSLGSELRDFTDTAAVIQNLDVVIAVDTSVAHLAGALGKPVWILLPFSPDWRWLLNRDASPWYPSARLFRQETTGDWTLPVGRVREALAKL